MAREWTSSPIGSVELSSSNPERVGRDGFLGLRFERRFGRTTLGQCRFKLPLQALAPVELADGTAYLMLLNPTGGLVGGDCLLTQIVQEADTRVCLTTPSATRVYRTRAQAAVQETQIQIGEGSVLEYLPDHVIPHRNSKFRQSLHVEMARGSRAIFWDALAAGRVAHGERWNFHEIDSYKEISLRGQPVFLNRTRIRPAGLDPERLGFAEGFNYLATLVIVADEWEGWKETVAAMDTELRNMPQVYGGGSTLASGGCIVKLLARSASDLMAAQAALWRRARQIVLGSPVMDLRKY
jgi:urease accessory protein